jgi:hypothetical protein
MDEAEEEKFQRRDAETRRKMGCNRLSPPLSLRLRVSAFPSRVFFSAEASGSVSGAFSCLPAFLRVCSSRCVRQLDKHGKNTLRVLLCLPWTSPRTIQRFLSENRPTEGERARAVPGLETQRRRDGWCPVFEICCAMNHGGHGEHGGRCLPFPVFPVSSVVNQDTAQRRGGKAGSSPANPVVFHCLSGA